MQDPIWNKLPGNPGPGSDLVELPDSVGEYEDKQSRACKQEDGGHDLAFRPPDTSGSQAGKTHR
jgi:hypothetical protein